MYKIVIMYSYYKNNICIFITRIFLRNMKIVILWFSNAILLVKSGHPYVRKVLLNSWSNLG